MIATVLSMLVLAAPADAPVGDLLRRIDGKAWAGEVGIGNAAGDPQWKAPKVTGSAHVFPRPEGEQRFLIVDTVVSGEKAFTAGLVITFYEEKGLLRGQIDEIMPGGSAHYVSPAIGLRRGNTLSFVSTEKVLEAGMKGHFWVFLELDEPAPRVSFGIERADRSLATIIGGTFH